MDETRAWKAVSREGLTAAQQERIKVLDQNGPVTGGVERVLEIPAGSVLVMKRSWVEIVEPESTGLQAWDLGL